MDNAVPLDFKIGFEPETLESGSPEECATFGKFTIAVDNLLLTEGFDHYIQARRTGPLVSAYFAAEWFAWNWWRLRWEPRGAGPDWDFAHRMNCIGEGYVWPNVAISSDGVRTKLLAVASRNPDAKPFRYFGALPVFLPSSSFESAVDDFIGQVLGRLHERSIHGSNLEILWRDVLAERQDPAIALRRRLEAMLGREPDAINDDQIEQLVTDIACLGEKAVEEVAADRGFDGSSLDQAMTAENFVDLAQAFGVDAVLNDAVHIDGLALAYCEPVIPAWRYGAIAAKAVRTKENLGAVPISNNRLTSMAGTSTVAIHNSKNPDRRMSFLLNDNAAAARIVIDAPREEGRRFNLARILGDMLLNPAGRLHPATRAYTYRQQAQRAFAAELLSPIDNVKDMLGGDYSSEKQQKIAQYFNVSEVTINTLLVNHRLIDREYNEIYNETLAA
jgi:Zn-dependent peptidase ImmA (M78 family)